MRIQGHVVYYPDCRVCISRMRGPPSVDQDMPVVSGDTLAEAWVVGKLMATYISWT